MTDDAATVPEDTEVPITHRDDPRLDRSLRDFVAEYLDAEGADFTTPLGVLIANLPEGDARRSIGTILAELLAAFGPTEVAENDEEEEDDALPWDVENDDDDEAPPPWKS
jgi:hypothetical protein